MMKSAKERNCVVSQSSEASGLKFWSSEILDLKILFRKLEFGISTTSRFTKIQLLHDATYKPTPKKLFLLFQLINTNISPRRTFLLPSHDWSQAQQKQVWRYIKEYPIIHFKSLEEKKGNFYVKEKASSKPRAVLGILVQRLGLSRSFMFQRWHIALSGNWIYKMNRRDPAPISNAKPLLAPSNRKA